MLAILTPFTSWVVGALVGLVGVVVGMAALKWLVRRRVTWWSRLVAPALTFGPAVGFLVGSFLERGTADAIAFWDWSTPTHPAARLGWSLILFFGATATMGLVRSFLESRIVREEMGLQIPQVLLDLGQLFVWAVAAFAIVAGVWRTPEVFTALFTAGAVTTLVLGLALQDTIKNFIGAWSIVGEGVYKLGDWVWIGDQEGEVVSITRRATKICNRTGDVVTFPNHQVVATSVRNESRPTALHAEFVVLQAAYDAPPNRVRDVLRRAVTEVPKILATPPPLFRVTQFADSGIEYQVKIWITDIASAHDIKSDLRAHIWYHFQREGIEFPYPVREVRRRAAPAVPAETRSTAVLRRLQSAPFFSALPEDLLGLLARDASLAAYGAGERVVQQRESGDTCYVVDAGRLAVLVSDGSIERQVAVLGPGDLFGEMSLLTGEPRSATVRVLEDARLVAVGSSALKTALERSPELAQRLAEVAALRREGLLEARAALDAQARARVDAQAKRLGDAIKRFFRLGDLAWPDAPPASSPPAGGASPPP